MKLEDCTNASDAAKYQMMLFCKHNRSGVFDFCQEKCWSRWRIDRLHHEDVFEPIIYGYVFPVLVLFVVVANIFIVLVLSKPHMVTSATNIVLLYMAIADLFVGVVPIPYTIFYYTFGNYKRPENLELWWCYMYKFLMDALPPICHNIAMWLTVLLALQRFISIQYPVKFRQWCKIRNVKRATVIIAAASMLHGLPKFFDKKFSVFEGIVGMNTTNFSKRCIAGPSSLMLSLGTNNYYNAYFWTRALLFITIPCVSLIILNAFLLRGIKKAQQRKERLLREKRQREAQRQNESNSTSVMLVVIVTIFLIVNLPQAIFLALLCVSTTFKLEWKIFFSAVPLYFLLIDNMLILATYPINFAIYCFMSSQFRETFKRLFLRNLAPIPVRRSFSTRQTVDGASAHYSHYSTRNNSPARGVSLSSHHSKMSKNAQSADSVILKNSNELGHTNSAVFAEIQPLTVQTEVHANCVDTEMNENQDNSVVFYV